MPRRRVSALVGAGLALGVAGLVADQAGPVSPSAPPSVVSVVGSPSPGPSARIVTPFFHPAPSVGVLGADGSAPGPAVPSLPMTAPHAVVRPA